MARLNFHDILVDPDLTDYFGVYRRKEVISNHGRSGVQIIHYPRVIGVVTMSDPNGLNRSDDNDSNPRTISVICNFPLRGESNGYKPDLIEWRGSKFVVIDIAPYPQFGQGFFETICGSINRQDEALLPDNAYAQLVFNNKNHSQYIPLL